MIFKWAPTSAAYTGRIKNDICSVPVLEMQNAVAGMVYTTVGYNADK